MELAARAEVLGKPQRGIKGISILSDLPDFDIVRCLDLDIFHALVNVAKRFASLWFHESYSSKSFNISGQFAQVDRRLTSILPTSDVSRGPRSLTERSDYRGHEWFYFVVIFSLPVLKNVLPMKFLNHWSLLVHGVAILMQNSVTKSELAYADRYLQQFAAGIDDLYGAENVTFSVHLLTHLQRSTEDFAQPWTHSAFIFESFNSEIKDAVKSSNGAALQISKAMQLKVAVQKLEDDLKANINPQQQQYLHKMSGAGTRLAAPHLVLEAVALLGNPTVLVLPEVSYVAIRRAGGKIMRSSAVSVYDRAVINGTLFHSINYSRVSKQNNSLALLESNNVFLIESFVVLSTSCFVLGYYYEKKRNQKICDKALPHYIILKDTPENILRCVEASQIVSKLISVLIDLSPTEILHVGCVDVLLMEMLR
jgi:hypothetical protein